MDLSSRELLQALKADGWYEVSQAGSHLHLKHPVKKGKVTVPHPKASLPMGTVKSILKQAGLPKNLGASPG